MLRNLPIVLLLACFLTSSTGCSTLVSGKRQDLPVLTTPKGATVTVGGTVKTSPAVFGLSRKEKSYMVEIEKEGYQPVSIVLNRGVNGWLLGNFLFGQFVGLAVDFGTGAAYKFRPDEIMVDLIKKEYGESALKDKDFIFVKLVERVE